MRRIPFKSARKGAEFTAEAAETGAVSRGRQSSAVVARPCSRNPRIIYYNSLSYRPPKAGWRCFVIFLLYIGS